MYVVVPKYQKIHSDKNIRIYRKNMFTYKHENILASLMRASLQPVSCMYVWRVLGFRVWGLGFTVWGLGIGLCDI